MDFTRRARSRSARRCSSEDGKFQYQLDYGAVSEAAEGNWSSDSTTVYLTATRMGGAFKARNFNREPLKIEGDRLLLNRYDTVIRFERESLILAPTNARRQEIWGALRWRQWPYRRLASRSLPSEE